VNYYTCPPFNFPPCPNIVEALEKAMRGESDAIKFYGRLSSMAPDNFQKGVISKIREDEEKHLNNFQTVYCIHTGHPYILPESSVNPAGTYQDGLMKAFKDEQEAYEFYKTVFFCYNDQTIKCVFLDALMDEAEHARWFNNLLIRMIKEEPPCHHHYRSTNVQPNTDLSENDT
jgi:rubrerythrin